MKKHVWWLCICASLCVGNAFADTVVLKTGQKIEGKITDRNNEAIRINYEGVDIGYLLSEVDSINGEKPEVVLTPAAAQTQASAATDTQATVPVSADTQSPVVNAPVVQPVIEPVSVVPAPVPAQVVPAMPSLPGRAGAISPTVAPALAAGLIMAILGVLLVFYIFSAICLQIISSKTQIGTPWMAWVPVANLFLMCKIAGLSYWWILLMLAGLIPWVGWVTTAVFNGYVWYKIALARNKPGWVGVLALLPLVNLGVIGYLAFSE